MKKNSKVKGSEEDQNDMNGGCPICLKGKVNRDKNKCDKCGLTIAQIKKELRMRNIAVELGEYFERIRKEAVLCQKEAIRALDRACETEEMKFRINDEVLEASKFFRVLQIIITTKLPSEQSLASFFISSEQKVEHLITEIDAIRDFLYKIPGARLGVIPEIYKKVSIRTSVEIR